MHVTTRGHGFVDLPQNFQELLGAMAGHAIADDLARFHIQRGKQRGRAVQGAKHLIRWQIQANLLPDRRPLGECRMKKVCRKINVEIVKRTNVGKFVVLPKRWVVERTIG
jgi:hypothetical protein